MEALYKQIGKENPLLKIQLETDQLLTTSVKVAAGDFSWGARFFRDLRELFQKQLKDTSISENDLTLFISLLKQYPVYYTRLIDVFQVTLTAKASSNSLATLDRDSTALILQSLRNAQMIEEIARLVATYKLHALVNERDLYQQLLDCNSVNGIKHLLTKHNADTFLNYAHSTLTEFLYSRRGPSNTQLAYAQTCKKVAIQWNRRLDKYPAFVVLSTFKFIIWISGELARQSKSTGNPAYSAHHICVGILAAMVAKIEAESASLSKSNKLVLVSFAERILSRKNASQQFADMLSNRFRRNVPISFDDVSYLNSTGSLLASMGNLNSCVTVVDSEWYTCDSEITLVQSLDHLSPFITSIEDSTAVGLDCEFVDDKLCTIQLCFNDSKKSVYIIDAVALDKQDICTYVYQIFAAESCVILGFELREDVRLLSEAANGMDESLSIDNLPASRIRDLKDLFKTHFTEAPNKGLAGLCYAALNKNLDKRPRACQWDFRPLSSTHILYAGALIN